MFKEKFNDFCIKNIEIGNKKYFLYDLSVAAKKVGFELRLLPYSLRVMFENVLRTNKEPHKLFYFKEWIEKKSCNKEVNFYPSRVLMQDLTGVPGIVDLASMRDAMVSIGSIPKKINPLIPVDLIVDHSVQVDFYANNTAFSKNVEKEFERNTERYELLKWGQNNFNNFRVVPPGMGICHQVNIEYLAKIVWNKVNSESEEFLYPDTVVGTDSHTTMVNSLAVLGWGVGGIEAEAAMLGQPIPMILPEVVGVRLFGKLRPGITATDLVLTITKLLREQNVVNKFVEFFGEGVREITLADRATISNMAPEYGATCGFFPVDQETLEYFKLTGREQHLVDVVEKYSKHQSLWLELDKEPLYSQVLEVDLALVDTSLAGPKRPQDLVLLKDMKENFIQFLLEKNSSKGSRQEHNNYMLKSKGYSIKNGDVVIAAITSCTNTSNPYVMIAAGLIAKKAVESGIQVKPWVKTSLAPGSKVVTDYLEKAKLDTYLDQLGFNLVGYGCTTCIGNSGPLDPELEKVVKENNIVVASVLSGNRNFEGRIHPVVKANYLASPPLVVLYALVGSVNIDVTNAPITTLQDGREVFIEDLWPSTEEINFYVKKCVKKSVFLAKYKDIFLGDENWQKIKTTKSDIFNWNPNSTYIKNPPYFANIKKENQSLENIRSAKILAILGNSITTDHISPAGNISIMSPAAKYLQEHNVAEKDFNSYGSRRGNHEVMIRGTFANIRILNKMCQGKEGGFSVNLFTKETQYIFDVAMDYKARYVPSVIFGGAEYGTGSSRDWAAKGTKLLGVRAVIAESFERIHRSNLVGMGVFPITLKNISLSELNLSGEEEIDILGLDSDLKPRKEIICVIRKGDNVRDISAILEVYTDIEIQYILNDNLLSFVTKKLASV